MQQDELRTHVAAAIRQLGVPEVSRRLGLRGEVVLRLAVEGARPHPGTVALALANVHTLTGGGPLPSALADGSQTPKL